MNEDYMKTIAQKCGEQVTDLIHSNLVAIIADAQAKDSDKAGASVSINLERGPNGYTVKTKLTYTSRTTDEIEGYVDRPDQVRMDFKKEK